MHGAFKREVGGQASSLCGPWAVEFKIVTGEITVTGKGHCGTVVEGLLGSTQVIQSYTLTALIKIG